MPNVTVTLAPAGALTLGAKWTILGSTTGWHASGVTVVLSAGTYSIVCNYIEGYSTPAPTSITVAAIALTPTITYGAVSWLSTWAPPISIAYWRGQVFTCGNVDLDADARKVRWSEIGAMRFLGATANPLRNEAGEFSLPNLTGKSTNLPVRLLPLSTAMIVYGTGGAYALKPVTQPVPSFGIETLEGVCGILNPLAVAGNEEKHVFVDSKGSLHQLSAGKGLEDTIIGYDEIFSDMQKDFDISTGAGLISIVYNPDDDEFYISDGRRSFLFNGEALTEIGKAYTSYVNIHSSVLSRTDKNLQAYSAVFDLDNTEFLYIETDTIDLKMSAIKTITSVDILGSFGSLATMEVMIKWRNDRRKPFRDTPWRRCSPSGFCSPNVSGADLKICIRVRGYTDVVINNVMFEWQLSDKSSVRGSYTNAASSTAESN